MIKGEMVTSSKAMGILTENAIVWRVTWLVTLRGRIQGNNPYLGKENQPAILSINRNVRDKKSESKEKCRSEGHSCQ
jgi:hypothetical protein